MLRDEIGEQYLLVMINLRLKVGSASREETVKQTKFLTALLIATVAGTGIAQAHTKKSQKCVATTPGQIEALFDQFNGAWATKDPQKVTALFTKEPVLLATVSNAPRTTPAAVNDYFVSFLKASPVGKIDTSTVEVDCKTATRLGTWTVSLTDPVTGAKSDVKARYSFIYRYEDGAWKIDHLHSSKMPEVAAAN